MKPKRPPASTAISVLMALLAVVATCTLAYNEHVEREFSRQPTPAPSASPSEGTP